MSDELKSAERGDYQVVIDFREKMGREPTPEEIFALGFGMVGGYEMGRTAGMAELEKVARQAFQAAREQYVFKDRTVFELRDWKYLTPESWWAQRKSEES